MDKWITIKPTLWKCSEKDCRKFCIFTTFFLLDILTTTLSFVLHDFKPQEILWLHSHLLLTLLFNHFYGIFLLQRKELEIGILNSKLAFWHMRSSIPLIHYDFGSLYFSITKLPKGVMRFMCLCVK